MSIFRIFRLGIRVAAWATPHVQAWHRRKHLNRTEGQRHLQARNWTEAEKYLTAALEEKHSTKNRVVLFAQLAKAQARQNKLELAANTARSGADLATSIGDSAALCEVLDSLAQVKLAQGDNAGAIETLESLERAEYQRVPPDLSRIAQSSRQRAKLLLQAGRTSEALAVLDGCLKLAEKAFGPEHIETAHAFAEVGSLCSKSGNHAEAQDYLKRALQVYRTTSGLDSDEATEGLHNLAVSLEESGDFEGATVQYERFIQVRDRQVGGGDRVGLADAQVRLAALYIQSGRSSNARELLPQAITVLEKNKGAALRDALEIMAVAEDEANRPREAALWREKAAKLSGAS